MKNKALSLKKLFLCLNVVVMIFMVAMTLSSTNVYAAELDKDEVNRLYYGYDVTCGKPIRNDTILTRFPIIDEKSDYIKYIHRNETASQDSKSYDKQTMLGVAKEYGTSIGAGISGDIKVVQVDLGGLFQKSTSMTDIKSERYQIFSSVIESHTYNVQLETNEIRQYLSERFRNDLYNVKSDKDAKDLFRTYGTHLFTGYVYGGLLEVTNYLATNNSRKSLSKVTSLEGQVDAAIKSINVDVEFDIENTYKSEIDSSDTVSKYECKLRGGVAVSGVTLNQLFHHNQNIGLESEYVYNSWIKSINRNENLEIVGTPAGSNAIPVWNLLPVEPEYLDAKHYLLNAYVDICGDKYNEYCTKYDYGERNDVDTVNCFVNGLYYTSPSGFTSFINYDGNKSYEVEPGSKIRVSFDSDLLVGNYEWKSSDEKNLKVIDKKNGVFEVVGTNNNIQFNASLNEIDGDTEKYMAKVYFKSITPKYSGGIGVEGNPYIISKNEDLTTLIATPDDWDKHFLLINDLDFKHASINSIQNFAGVFDGGYNNIKNVNFDNNNISGDYLGLFCVNNGTIKNLNIVGNTTTPESENIVNDTKALYYGVLVGQNKGTITNCSVSNVIFNIRPIYTTFGDGDDLTVMKYWHAGLLCGENQGTIEQCSVYNSKLELSVDVSAITGKDATVYAGGLVGISTKGKISDCYTRNLEYVTTKAFGNCKNALGISKNDSRLYAYSGGFIGKIADSSLTNCISDVDAIGITAGCKWTKYKNTQNESEFKRCLFGLIEDTDTGTTKLLNCFNKAIDEAQKDEYVALEVKKCTVQSNATTSKNTITYADVASKFSGSKLWTASNDSYKLPVLIKQNYNKETSLVIDMNLVKTNYYFGEEFNMDGLVVELVDCEGNKERVPFYNVDFSNFKSNELGTYVIKVTFGSFTATYSVNVIKCEVEQIVFNDLNKYTGYIGETFNPSLDNVSYIISNGQRITDTNLKYVNYVNMKDLVIDSPTLIHGINRVKISCGSNLKYDIFVKGVERKVESMEIKTPSRVTKYLEGQKVDLDGMEILVHFADGSTKVITGHDVEIIGDQLVSGKNDVLLAYGGYHVLRHKIDAEERNISELTSIEIVKQPTKLDYIIGEEIKLDGILVNGKFKDGFAKAIDISNITVENVKLVEGKNTITITCNNLTKTFDVNAKYILITWDVEGKTEVQKCELNELPKFTGEAKKEGSLEYKYEFAGWDKEVKPATKDEKYTATFKKVYIDYVVEFVDFDGRVIDSKKYHYGDLIVKPANPTREGYEFTGWSSDITKCEGNAKITAQYKANQAETYKVIFKDYNGTVLLEATYTLGETIVYPTNPTREGYEFTGWSNNSKVCTGNMTITAQYKANQEATYKVIFKDYNGTVLSEANYKLGANIIYPGNPTREGYEFTGWDNSSKVCTGDMIITAQYKSVSTVRYTVKFIDFDGRVISETTYNKGDKIVYPTNPTREADKKNTYTFVSWNSTPEFCESDLTIQAIYSTKAIEYVVKFMNPDGTVLKEDKYNYGDVIVVPIETPKLDGYKFTGWKNFSSVCSGNMVFEASFEKIAKSTGCTGTVINTMRNFALVFALVLLRKFRLFK